MHSAWRWSAPQALEITAADPDHSATEDRFVSIGRAKDGNLLMVCFTERARTIRIISAREPTKRERRAYEKDRAK